MTMVVIDDVTCTKNGKREQKSGYDGPKNLHATYIYTFFRMGCFLPFAHDLL